MSSQVKDIEPKQVVVPRGQMAEYIPRIIASFKGYQWARYLTLAPYAVDAEGKSVAPPATPHAPESLLKIQEVKATIPASGNNAEWHEQVGKWMELVQTVDIDSSDGRPSLVLYDRTTNKPLKEEELRKRLRCDSWFEKCLINYKHLLKPVSRGDIFQIWSRVLEEGRPEPHLVTLRRTYFYQMHVQPGQSYRDYWAEVNTEVSALMAWKVRIPDGDIERRKIDGLLYHLEYVGGYARAYKLSRSHYFDVIKDENRLAVRKVEDLEQVSHTHYEVRLRDYDRLRVSDKPQRNRRPVVGMFGSDSVPQPNPKPNGGKPCYKYRKGNCDRKDCAFSHTGPVLTEGMRDKCKAENACVDFNLGICNRKKCHFEHVKINTARPAKPTPKCKKCKKAHKGRCKTTTSLKATVEGDEGDSSEGEDSELGEEVVVGSLAMMSEADRNAIATVTALLAKLGN